jgi:hypothetical protein
MTEIKGKLEKKISTDDMNLVPAILFGITGLAATALSTWMGIETFSYLNKGNTESGIAYLGLSVGTAIISLMSYYNSIKFLKKK